MSLHPHWDSTGEEQEIPVRSSTPASKPEERQAFRIPIGGGRVSRRPAAIVGMLIVIGFGLVYSNAWELFNGIPQFLGQLQGTSSSSSSSSAQTTPTFHLLKNATNPTSLTIQAGQTITFQNDSDLPQILQIQGLMDQQGKTFAVPAIFPSMSDTFAVSATQAAGTYDLISVTDSLMHAQVIVTANGNASLHGTAGGFGDTSGIPLPGYNPDPSWPTLQPSNGTMNSASSFPQVPNSSSANSVMAAPIVSSSTSSIPAQDFSNLFPFGAGESAASVSSSAAVDLPTNPYTVGATIQNPGETAATDEAALHPGAEIGNHRPKTTAETGPELWITIVLSFGFMAWMMRKNKMRI